MRLPLKRTERFGLGEITKLVNLDTEIPLICLLQNKLELEQIGLKQLQQLFPLILLKQMEHYGLLEMVLKEGWALADQQIIHLQFKLAH